MRYTAFRETENGLPQTGTSRTFPVGIKDLGAPRPGSRVSCLVLQRHLVANCLNDRSHNHKEAETRVHTTVEKHICLYIVRNRKGSGEPQAQFDVPDSRELTQLVELTQWV